MIYIFDMVSKNGEELGMIGVMELVWKFVGYIFFILLLEQ